MGPLFMGYLIECKNQHLLTKAKFPHLLFLLLLSLSFLLACASSATPESSSNLVYVTVTPAPTVTALPKLTESSVDFAALEGGWGGEFKLDDQN